MRTILLIVVFAFSLVASATSDYYVPLKQITLEGFDGKSSVTVKLNVKSSLTEQIRIKTEFGTFDIPDEHINKLREPDLRSVEFLFNPGGAKFNKLLDGSMDVQKWGLYYVFKMYFDDESTEEELIKDDDRPQFEAIIEDGKLREIGFKRVVPCEGEAIKCWETNRTKLNLEPNQ